MSYDLLLKGARVMDPAQGVDGIRDVGIVGEKIAAVAEEITAPAAETIDLSGKILTPGWIDIHAHLYAGCTTWGIRGDALCLAHGRDDNRRCWKRGVGQLRGICRLCH